MDNNNTTVTVNGKQYALNDSFRDEIEQIAENEYGENEFLSYYWRVADDSDDEHNEGDALLCIETEGKMVPWDKLSEFEMQMESVGPQFIMPDTNGDDSDHSDNGNGTQSIDGDSTPASGDDTVDDFKLPMFPRGYRPIPDADDGRFDTVPPAPKKYDESEPILLVPIPMDTREERWAAGEAMIPVSTYVEWNMQRRADTAPAYGTESHGHSHDKWEAWLESHECDVVATVQPKNPPREEMPDDEEVFARRDLGGKFGGNNWNI